MSFNRNAAFDSLKGDSLLQQCNVVNSSIDKSSNKFFTVYFSWLIIAIELRLFKEDVELKIRNVPFLLNMLTVQKLLIKIKVLHGSET